MNGRKAGAHSFVMFPHHLLRHQSFNALSAIAVKALMFLAAQYRGHNNGDLTIAYSVARKMGVTGNGSLRRGAMELIEAGFVITTRQGGRNRCSLFALTWFAIDECGGKLDVSATRVPPIDWHKLGNLSKLNGVQRSSPEVQSNPIPTPQGFH